MAVDVSDPKAPALPLPYYKPRTDVARAFLQLTKKRMHFNRLFDYYDGNQPIVYATDMLSQYFRNLEARFTMNWCGVVVDSILDRLTLKQLDTENESANDILTTLVEAGGLELEAYDAHTACLVTGEAFIIVWPNEEDPSQIDCYANDPRLMAMFYRADRPREKAFAAKWFLDENTQLTHLTLYYPDRLEYYVTRTADRPETPDIFVPDTTVPGATNGVAENPYGVVPVFHFRRNRRRTIGELEGKVITLQDMVNKLLADMMVTGEFAAFGQRWAITNADLSNMKAHPGELWKVPPAADGEQQTALGMFPQQSLDGFLNAIDALSKACGVISHTPKHYFYVQGGDPSGEALIAQEAPLVKKCLHFTELFGATWRDLAAFYCTVAGTKVTAQDIKPVWEPLETEQPDTESMAFHNWATSGLPVKTTLRHQGWSDEDIDEMQADQQEEAKLNGPSMADVQLAMVRAQQNANGSKLPTNSGESGENQPGSGTPVQPPTPHNPESFSR